MHNLDRLEITIRERITSVKEEIEIATNSSPNMLEIENLREEVHFLEWSSQHIQLITTHNDIQKVVHKETNNQQEVEDTVQFEQLLRDRIHSLILTLDFNHNRKKANSHRNEKNTLESILSHLSTLKYDELPSSPSEMMEVNGPLFMQRIDRNVQ